TLWSSRIPPFAAGGASRRPRPLPRLPGGPPRASAAPARISEPTVANATARVARVLPLMDLLPLARRYGGSAPVPERDPCTSPASEASTVRIAAFRRERDAISGQFAHPATGDRRSPAT